MDTISKTEYRSVQVFDAVTGQVIYLFDVDAADAVKRNPTRYSLVLSAAQNSNLFNFLNIPLAQTLTPFAQMPDMAPAIQAALDATPANGTLYIPPGTYKLVGSGTSILTRATAITLIGIGTPLFIIDPSVPSTRNIFTIKPTGPTYGWEIAGLQIAGSGGTPYGQHAINIDLTTSGGLLYESYFHDLILNPTAGGNSFFATNVNANGGIFNSVFERNLCESFNLLNVGDNLEIRDNTINSTSVSNAGITFYQVSGAGNLKIYGNAIATLAGHIIAESGIETIIRDNEFETPPGLSNLLGALILVNNAGGANEGCQIVNNQIQVLTGVGNPIPIKIGAGVESCWIHGGRLAVISGSHISILATASNTKIDPTSIEAVVNGVVGRGPTVTDAGTGTNILPLWIGAGLVSALPAAAAALKGARGYVTDANATFTAGIGAVAAGGGANIVPVFCDGTNWRIG